MKTLFMGLLFAAIVLSAPANTGGVSAAIPLSTPMRPSNLQNAPPFSNDLTAA